MFLTLSWKGHELDVDTHISVWLFGVNGGLVEFTKEILKYKKNRRWTLLFPTKIDRPSHH